MTASRVMSYRSCHNRKKIFTMFWFVLYHLFVLIGRSRSGGEKQPGSTCSAFSAARYAEGEHNR
jgi:hypothetical protein